MLELCSTPGWQVGSHCWILEQFPGLEVVVHVLEIVNWVIDEKNRLPRHWIYMMPVFNSPSHRQSTRNFLFVDALSTGYWL